MNLNIGSLESGPVLSLSDGWFREIRHKPTPPGTNLQGSCLLGDGLLGALGVKCVQLGAIKTIFFHGFITWSP